MILEHRSRSHPGIALPVNTARRRLLAASAALAASGLLLYSRHALAAPQIGQPAPDFSAVGSDGKTYALQQFQGQLVVLEWTNHDCPFVRKHYQSNNIPDLQREATAAGAVWLSVISSAPGEQGHVSADEANALTASRKAAPTAVLLDPEGIVGRAYAAQTTPHLYIIAADGQLVYNGGIDSIASTRVEDLQKATPLFRNALQEVLAGKPVSTAATRPYGCNVKYAPA